MAKNIRIEVLDGCFIAAPALAQLFDCSADMVRRYVNDYGMPRVANGKYLLADCVQWYINRLRLQATGGDSNDVAQEKLKLVRAQRHRVELDNKRRRGEMIEAEDVTRVLNQMASIYASQLDGLAARAAAIVADMDDPGAIQRVLFDECRAIRESTAAATIDLAHDYDHGRDHATAEKPKRGPVGGRKPHTTKRVTRARRVAN